MKPKILKLLFILDADTNPINSKYKIGKKAV